MASFGSRSYWIVFSLFLGLAFVKAWSETRTSPATGAPPRFTTPPQTQRRPLRVEALRWVDNPPLGSRSAPPGNETRHRPPAGPARIEAEAVGSLFVVDDGDGETIGEYSANGGWVRSLDPKPAMEIASVTDLAIRPDRLWVSDLLGSSVHVFDRTTHTWSSSHLDPAPYRIEMIDDPTPRLLLMHVATPWLLDIVSSDGAVIRSFGDLLREQDRYSLTLDGFIDRTGDDYVFAGRDLGILASFSSEGETNWLVESIAPPDPPRLMETERRRWIRSAPLPASLSMACSHETICVLTRRTHGLAVRSFLDLYRARDGAYEKSLLLPAGAQWTSVAISESYLFAANERAVVRWPYTITSGTGPETSRSTGRTIIALHPKPTD